MPTLLKQIQIAEISSVDRAANPHARLVFTKRLDDEPDEDDVLPDHYGETAAGKQLLSMVNEHMKSPHGKGLSRKMAMSHIATSVDGARLDSAHKKQLAYMASMKQVAKQETKMDTFESVLKAVKTATPTEITKALNLSRDSGAEILQKRNQGMSWTMARDAVSTDRELGQGLNLTVAAERTAMLLRQGHLREVSE